MLPAKAGFKFKLKIPDYDWGKANPPPNFGGLTTPYDLPDLRGRNKYFEYLEDKAKASLRAKCLA